MARGVLTGRAMGTQNRVVFGVFSLFAFACGGSVDSAEGSLAGTADAGTGASPTPTDGTEGCTSSPPKCLANACSEGRPATCVDGSWVCPALRDCADVPSEEPFDGPLHYR